MKLGDPYPDHPRPLRIFPLFVDEPRFSALSPLRPKPRPRPYDWAEHSPELNEPQQETA